MSQLQRAIESALQSALKQRDALKLSVYRLLSAAIHNREIEKRTASGGGSAVALTEEEIVAVVRSESKKRRDAIEAYRAAGRSAASEREQAEADILASLLPKDLSDEELVRMVSQGKAALGVNSPKDFGKLMGWVMERVKGQAEGERVRKIIQQHLSSA